METEKDSSAQVQALFDRLGDREWERLETDSRSRVALEIHRRFLRRFVPPGTRVLEIGAGPGRFTIQLARMGSRLVVSDVSPVQLRLNGERLAAAGLERFVEDRLELDVRDLRAVADGSFDAVVAFGGPLSYAFEQAEESLAGLLRVVRPGGVVVASVMALVGTLRFYLPAVPSYAAEGRLDVLERVVTTGDNRYDADSHPCRMFRWREISAMVDRLPCHLLGASASNFLSCGDQSTVAALEADPSAWPTFLAWEEELCAEPGALDGGTHLLFALQRT